MHASCGCEDKAGGQRKGSISYNTTVVCLVLYRKRVLLSTWCIDTASGSSSQKTMQLLLVGILLLLLLVCPPHGEGAKKSGNSQKKSSSSTSSSKVGAEYQGKERLKAINTILIENTARSTIKLVDSNFTKYVMDRPRPYHAAIFLTAIAKKYDCTICRDALKEYRKSAKYYGENYKDLLKIPEENRIVFFVLGKQSFPFLFCVSCTLL